jgi:23S rRNA (pseudouridine1915-N3)-methyltransferase
MFKLHLIVVGKLKDDYWKSAEAEYLKRLQPFATIVFHELKEESFTEKDPVDFIKEKEAKKILEVLAEIKPSFTIALEEKGASYTSPALAQKLQMWIEAHHTLAIIIGGPLGLHETVRTQTNTILSLSPLTFTHQMTRVILLEQLYRSIMITGGRRYHY